MKLLDYLTKSFCFILLISTLGTPDFRHFKLLELRLLIRLLIDNPAAATIFYLSLSP